MLYICLLGSSIHHTHSTRAPSSSGPCFPCIESNVFCILSQSPVAQATTSPLVVDGRSRVFPSCESHRAAFLYRHSMCNQTELRCAQESRGRLSPSLFEEVKFLFFFNGIFKAYCSNRNLLTADVSGERPSGMVRRGEA